MMLTENFKNFFVKDKNDRLEFVDRVWDVIQDSYRTIGGIKGNGFKSKTDMVKNIPFWKLFVRDDKVLVVVMYKDKGGRKSVVTAINKEIPEAKDILRQVLKQEFTRSMSEKSDPLLRFTINAFPDLVKKYAIPVDQAEKILGKPLGRIKGEKFLYKRVIGSSGETITKMLMGTPGKKITR